MFGTLKYISLVTASFLLLACSDGDSSYGGDKSDGSSNSILPSLPSVPKTITIEEDYQIEDLGRESQVKATVDVGSTPKSVYILLSNSSENKHSHPKIKHNRISQTHNSMKKKSSYIPTIYAKRGKHAPEHIREFSKNIKKLLKKSKLSKNEKRISINNTTAQKKDVIGSLQIFYTSYDTSSTTRATLRKVTDMISTSFGEKRVNIWVSDDSFGVGCKKARCVTQEMVDALADTFLKDGTNNDIYDWVTNIYGEEWSSKAQDKYSNLIGADGEITILLTDIDNDNSENGGVIGYFHPKDNYVSEGTNEIKSSNERVMFYIDAIMFANGDGDWEIDDAWPKEAVSTLAHEFVHMIEFYQKTVLSNTLSDTWLAEMLAETTEDMVATKIESSGPRGVEYIDGSAGESNNTEGRYGLFNEYNGLSLTTWDGKLADYSKVNAFGAYLTRNYGGATLLHDIMHNKYGDTKAIEYAVRKSPQGEEKTFDELLKEWGAAVLLSDRDNLREGMPSYNRGDFTVTQKGDVVYKLGSINFFNYTPKPTINTVEGDVEPQGNYYYKVGDNITGTVTIDLTLDDTTSATLVVK
jgi:hypothetical protein